MFGLYVYFRIFEYRSTVMVASIAFSIWNISFDSYTEIQKRIRIREPGRNSLKDQSGSKIRKRKGKGRIPVMRMKTSLMAGTRMRICLRNGLAVKEEKLQKTKTQGWASLCMT